MLVCSHLKSAHILGILINLINRTCHLICDGMVKHGIMKKSKLQRILSDTNKFPLNVHHTYKKHLQVSVANWSAYLLVMIMTFPCSMQGNRELVHKWHA